MTDNIDRFNLTDDKDRFRFRIWDINDKELLYGNEGTMDDWDRRGCNNLNILNYKLQELFDDDNCILMQCTGLKDKNGKLIYEGDIVKCITDSLDEDIHEIVYEGDKGYPAFELSNNQEEFNGISFYANEGEIEIIGNKFENPELLKND